MLGGIGLHLNALASTSNNGSLTKHDILESRGQLISMPSSNVDPLISGQKPLDMSLNWNSIERDLGPHDDTVQVIEDAISPFGIAERVNQSSPKKKRCKSEHDGGSEACKCCNCKKSKCLKLYCECFAAGLYCVEPCSCQDCFNKLTHEDTVLETRKQIESRNPLAFAPKVIRSSKSVPEFGDESNKTPASARHKRGCNCKKSSCLKKYCECFQGGVRCSISCRCEGCKNAFGRKYGTEETALQGEETEASEKNALDITLQNSVIRTNEQEHPDLVLPVTPLIEIGRPLVRLPLSSSIKPTQASLLAVGSSPQLCASQKPEQSGFPCHVPTFEKHIQMIPEDETPEILKSNCSPMSGMKSASPNCKRVLPPHRKFASSHAWRSGRRLILKSIPSFPSLARHKNNDS